MDKAKQGSASAVATGLRGVIAASSSIGDVNGDKGELIYQGINIHDLATKSTFEEVVFLLWNGRLPKRAELDELKQNLAASYEIPQWVRGPIEYFPKDAEPMDTAIPPRTKPFNAASRVAAPTPSKAKSTPVPPVMDRNSSRNS